MVHSEVPVPGRIEVEVAFALPERQMLIAVELAEGATVADAIAESGLPEQFPGESLEKLPTGIWGEPAGRDQVLEAGDRVEIYRPLQMDPKEARRRLARAGKTMRSSREPRA